MSRCILLLKVLLHVRGHVPWVSEIRPEVIPQLVDLRSELLAQVVQLRPDVCQTIVPQRHVEVRVGWEEHGLLEIMRAEQAVQSDERLECTAMVSIGEDQRLDPGKRVRWREFTQLWIVECFQVQELLQTRCWQLRKYILAEIQVLQSFEHGERVLFNLPDYIPL